MNTKSDWIEWFKKELLKAAKTQEKKGSNVYYMGKHVPLPDDKTLSSYGIYNHNGIIYLMDDYCGAMIEGVGWNKNIFYNEFFRFVMKKSKFPNALYCPPMYKFLWDDRISFLAPYDSYMMVNGCKIWVFQKSNLKFPKFVFDDLAKKYDEKGYMPEPTHKPIGRLYTTHAFDVFTHKHRMYCKMLKAHITSLIVDETNQIHVNREDLVSKFGVECGEVFDDFISAGIVLQVKNNLYLVSRDYAYLTYKSNIISSNNMGVLPDSKV